MLKVLGVSRSGYRAFLKRKLSATAKRKNSIKKEILKIYNDSKQNYGAPKITKLLQKSGETISQRTVGKYCVKWASGHNGQNHGLPQQKTLTLAVNFITYLKNSLILNDQTLSGVLTLHTSGPMTALCTLTV